MRLHSLAKRTYRLRLSQYVKGGEQHVMACQARVTCFDHSDPAYLWWVFSSCLRHQCSAQADAVGNSEHCIFSDLLIVEVIGSHAFG